MYWCSVPSWPPAQLPRGWRPAESLPTSRSGRPPATPQGLLDDTVRVSPTARAESPDSILILRHRVLPNAPALDLPFPGPLCSSSHSPQPLAA